MKQFRENVCSLSEITTCLGIFLKRKNLQSNVNQTKGNVKSTEITHCSLNSWNKSYLSLFKHHSFEMSFVIREWQGKKTRACTECRKVVKINLLPRVCHRTDVRLLARVKWTASFPSPHPVKYGVTPSSGCPLPWALDALNSAYKTLKSGGICSVNV